MKMKEMLAALENYDEAKLALLSAVIAKFDEVYIIGNGGSNAVAAHIAQDLTKCNGKRAHSFSDASRLTCYMNDYGVERAYEMYVKHFATKSSLVILISSSGNSVNILNAAQQCVNASIPFLILSGFKANNKLRTQFGSKALVEFWVDSSDYGVVECAHQVILHTAVSSNTQLSETVVVAIDDELSVSSSSLGMPGVVSETPSSPERLKVR